MVDVGGWGGVAPHLHLPRHYSVTSGPAKAAASDAVAMTAAAMAAAAVAAAAVAHDPDDDVSDEACLI